MSTSKTCSEIQNVLWAGDPYSAAANRDLFALGCALHATGYIDAGMKMCVTALRAARASNGLEARVIAALSGNERDFVDAAGPHSEIKSLIAEMIDKAQV